jgi:atypical dual specificity phosphatase
VRAGRPQLSRVLPRLIVGEYPNPDDLAWLRDVHGVTAVLSLQDEADLASKRLRVPALVRACVASGLTLHREPIPDGEAEILAKRLPAVVATLRSLLDGGACVYLHCNAGYNRAPTVAIAYLHRVHGLGIDAATAFVKARRSCVPYASALKRCYVG